MVTVSVEDPQDAELERQELLKTLQRIEGRLDRLNQELNTDR